MTRRKPPTLAPATLSEYEGVLSLHLGTVWIQGSMHRAKPNFVELEYVRRMLAALLWLPSESLGQGHALQLGLGAGALTRFTHKVLRMRTEVVELNPQVIALCRAFFHLPVNGGLLRVHEANAADFVREPARHGSVQLLQVDLYDHEAAAPVLDDDDFYGCCRKLLQPGGVMSVNLFGRDASFERSAARIAAAFGPEHVCSLRPTREGNTVVVATAGVGLPDRETLRLRAAHIEERFGAQGLAAREWLRMLRPYAAAQEAHS